MRVYEINTWPWLLELSERLGTEVTLASVPDSVWDEVATYHCDTVWLMGVWQRSPAGRAQAVSDPGVLASCAVLPGFNPRNPGIDIAGSPYSVKDYVVDDRLGGPQGLAAARAALRKRGIGLMLDYVPNHTAPDHPWVTAHPEYYVLDASRAPLPGNNQWLDTAQLDAFDQGYRDATVQTLKAIGDQCDGVRCDMAYLLRGDRFASTWSGKLKEGAPATEFWKEVIGQVKSVHGELTFIAESYEDSEFDLQQDGFDYAYDKDKLYDRLKNGDAASVRAHLGGSSLSYLEHLIHFIENHDEDPASTAFVPDARQVMAAVVTATVPGASLWYYLQLDGRWGKQVVQLGTSVTVRRFYQRLLAVTARPAIAEGAWTLCDVSGSGASSVLAWCWEKDDDRVIVVVNMSAAEAWASVTVPLAALPGRDWNLEDPLSAEAYVWSGDDLRAGRFVVGLAPWKANLFVVTATT